MGYVHMYEHPHPRTILISFWFIETRGNKFHTHRHWAMDLSLEITCERLSDTKAK